MAEFTQKNTPTPEQILNDHDKFFSLNDTEQDYLLANYADTQTVAKLKTERDKHKANIKQIDFNSFEQLKANFDKLRKVNIQFVLDEETVQLPLYLKKPTVAEVLSLNKSLEQADNVEFWENPDNIKSLKSNFKKLFYRDENQTELSDDALDIFLNDYNLTIQLILIVTTNGLIFKKN